ncbi:MAG: PHP domain-containing protein [Clostridia bacterium]|nr:PHP domain-containing protein [Clostridia bacterium]
MEITYDLHTHTKFSHGKGTIEENALFAKGKGLKGIGITDHGFSHPAFGMRRRRLDEMRRQVEEAKRRTGIEVYLGIESNIRGISGKIDAEERDYDKLDLLLAGYHKFIICDKLCDYGNMAFRNIIRSYLKMRPTERQIKFNTEMYINAIKNNPIDVLTHIGYCAPCDAKEVAKCARDYGTYIEINTKKTHLTDEEWREVIETGVNFVIDSDAHTPGRIGDKLLAEELFKRVEFPMDRIMNIDGKKPIFRFEEFKKRR